MTDIETYKKRRQEQGEALAIEGAKAFIAGYTSTLKKIAPAVAKKLQAERVKAFTTLDS